MGTGKPVLYRGQISEKILLLEERDILILACLYAWKVSLGLNTKLYYPEGSSFCNVLIPRFAEKWVLNTCLLNSQAFLMCATAHLSTFPTIRHSMIAYLQVPVGSAGWLHAPGEKGTDQ